MKQCQVFIMDEFMHSETKKKGDYSCDNVYDSAVYLQQQQEQQQQQQQHSGRNERKE